jgi:hypothetical protein
MFHPRIRHSVAGIALLSMAAVLAPADRAIGQIFRSTVGGVIINADGVLDVASPEMQKTATQMLQEKMQAVPEDLGPQTELRMVSLRGICEQIVALGVTETAELPDELRCLAGLQRVEYVVVVPERNDILLAGPGEAWTLSATGDYVGVTTGEPVVLLDDLLVALRSVESARQVGISCSIDPTPQGRQALRQYLGQQRQFRPNMVQELERVMGAQQITITGVPTDSHFARVLVASDYRMKRYAMHIEPAPIKGLPSFLQMMKASKARSKNIMPRWWLACDYDAVARTEDGLGWQIRGNGVKAMTEDEYVTDSGQVTGTGQVDPVAQKWSDNMTTNYAALSQADPVFGQLRNLMDLSIVAALIEREDLRSLAGCDLSVLYDSTGPAIEKWHAPKTVATHGSFLKQGRNFIVTASGGVQIDSWYYASQTEVKPELAKVVEKAAGSKPVSWRW